MRPFCCKQNKEQAAHLSRVKCGRIGRKVASTANIARTQNYFDVKVECQECHQMVKNLNKHYLRFHSSKYWGYKCNICNHCESRLDNSFFKKHMFSKHAVVVENLNVYKYDVVCGYKVPMKCPLCTFQCFEALDMKIHFSDMHPVVSQDRSNKVSSVGKVSSETSVSQNGSGCPNGSTSSSGCSDSNMESGEMNTSDDSVELLEMSVYLLNLDENISDTDYDFDNELDLLGD